MQNNGDDTTADGGDNPDPYEGVEGFESPDVPEDEGHPLADGNFNVTAFLDTVKAVAFQLKDNKAILIALVGLTVVSLLWALLSGFIVGVGQILEVEVLAGVLATVLEVALLPIAFVVGIFQTALYKPASQVVFGGEQIEAGPIELVKSTFSMLVPVGAAMVALGASMSIGILCCGIGAPIAAFLLGQAPYLTAVHDRGVFDGEAFKESFDRAINHWHVLLLGFGAMFVVILPISVVVGCGQAASSFVPVVGPMIGNVLNWLGTALMALIGFIIAVATFGIIDELEGLDTMIEGISPSK